MHVNTINALAHKTFKENLTFCNHDNTIDLAYFTTYKPNILEIQWEKMHVNTIKSISGYGWREDIVIKKE
jgi:hypothetical protein